MTHPDPMTTPWGEHFELTTHLIACEVIRRGHDQLTWLRPGLFVVQVDGRTFGWNMSRTVTTSTIGAEVTTRKDHTRTLLEQAGVAVAAGGAFRGDQHDRALACAERTGWPVVVKPCGGKKGRGVTVGVSDPDAFAAAWALAAPLPTSRAVVEAQQPGTEARMLVVDGRCVAVAGRTHAHVIGDGRSTTRQLVNDKNRLRTLNPHLRRALIRPEPGTDLERVPAHGERVIINPGGPANFSAGGDSRDLTDDVHPSYLQVAEAAYRALPGLGLAGIDLIASDWTQPAAAGNHIIVEVNSRPAIGAHHFPWEGKPRDVAAAIVDACGVPDRSPDPLIDDNDDDWIGDLDPDDAATW